MLSDAEHHGKGMKPFLSEVFLFDKNIKNTFLQFLSFLRIPSFIEKKKTSKTFIYHCSCCFCIRKYVFFCVFVCMIIEKHIIIRLQNK
ncbi:MAG: hypothetical protein CW341_10885 [Bacteroidetes bacterium]|nr:hypothetical protein [Bacteroidota bacterium]